MSTDDKDHVRQEADRIKTRLVVGVGLTALVVFAVGISWSVLIQRGLTGSVVTAPTAPVTHAGQREIGMVYQPIFAGAEIARDRSAPKRERLGSFGWVDPEHTTLHIPIEWAMKLVVEKGKL